MSMSPLHFAASLQIGTVDYAAPDKIGIKLDTEAPDSIAMNTGRPRPFPRINEYVLIPNDNGFMVGQVSWLTVENSAYPKRTGLKDFGLIDLPFPLRKMELNPLGTLTVKEMTHDGKNVYEFHRGVDAFPSVGDPVILPVEDQLHSIVEQGGKGRVKIGTSPLAGNADVRVDPDKLFGRHLAVLGNTGSGKSCSVAGLIRWSLEAAKEKCGQGKEPNARFIILDPDGEYGRAFANDSYAKIFSVTSRDKGEKKLQVPLWFWNSAEWGAFTRAGPGIQRPLLRRSLRAMRNGETEVKTDVKSEIKSFLGIIYTAAISCKNNGEPYKPFPYIKNFIERIIVWKESIENYNQKTDPPMTDLSDVLQELIKDHKNQIDNGFIEYKACSVPQIDALIETIKKTYESFGGSDHELLPVDEDVPVKFPGENFEKYLEALATETGNIQYIEPLLTRTRALLSDSHINTVVSDTSGISLSDWLTDYIGDTEKSDKTVTVIDLSLVPAELIHVLTAVVARMIFESLQRYHKINHTCLPTVLVMEEAHSFVKSYLSDSDEQSADSYCCQVFEKIAREGRKFGLGLVLSSQRPSELSPTVLSQCNTFLLHRISNREDQELVKCLVPDNLRSLLRDLPSLPSQNAVLLGWATELPVLVKMNTLPKEQQPRSDDPDFWDVWTGKEERAVDWEKIAEDWQQNAQDDTTDVSQEKKAESAEQNKTEGKDGSDTDTGFPEDIPF